MNTKASSLAVVPSARTENEGARLDYPYHEMNKALQTTLNVEQLLDHFSVYLQPVVPHNGYSFQNRPLTLEVVGGTRGRHHCSYDLVHEKENMGEWRLTRNKRFSELELTIIEDFLCHFLQPLRNALHYRWQLQSADIAPLTETRTLGMLPDSFRRDKELLRLGEFSVTHITPLTAYRVYCELEVPSWAPWLRYSPQEISHQARVFPEGQILVKDDNDWFLASLSTNRVNWNGDIRKLTTWDEIAGDTLDYTHTYVPDGDTLVLMSMSVLPSHQGKRIPSLLIDHLKENAEKLGVKHIISPFRPNGYRLAKSLIGYDLDFKRYCEMRKPGTDQPYDPWLRSLWWKQMRLLKIVDKAMVRTVSLEEFFQYHRVYNLGLWEEIEEDIWECGEVGRWYVNKATATATYMENNVWGEIPLNEHPAISQWLFQS